MSAALVGELPRWGRPVLRTLAGTKADEATAIASDAAAQQSVSRASTTHDLTCNSSKTVVDTSRFILRNKILRVSIPKVFDVTARFIAWAVDRRFLAARQHSASAS